MFLGGVDVVVSDGFSGNVVLKTAEGVAKWLFKELKDVFMMKTVNKLAAAVIKNDVKGIAKKIDPNEVGGTAFWVSASLLSKLTAHRAMKHFLPRSVRPPRLRVRA